MALECTLSILGGCAALKHLWGAGGQVNVIAVAVSPATRSTKIRFHSRLWLQASRPAVPSSPGPIISASSLIAHGTGVWLKDEGHCCFSGVTRQAWWAVVVKGLPHPARSLVFSGSGAGRFRQGGNFWREPESGRPGACTRNSSWAPSLSCVALIACSRF